MNTINSPKTNSTGANVTGRADLPTRQPLFRRTAASRHLCGKQDEITLAPLTFSYTAKNVSGWDLLRIAMKQTSPKNTVRHIPVLRSLACNLLTMKNWLEMTGVELGLKKKANAKFRNGSGMDNVCKANLDIYRLRRSAAYHNFPIEFAESRMTFNFEGNELTLVHPKGCVGDITAVFFTQHYGPMDYKGNVAVDVGAHVGDSAIYFALKGASAIYALEPYHYSCNMAIRNIYDAGLEKKITLLNAALAAKTGTVRIDPEFQNTVGSNVRDFPDGKEIPLFTLNDLVKKYDLKDAVLKLDCEGGEYSLLACDTDTLRAFNEIVIEYHYGYRNLKKKLEEAGFRIQVQPPHYNHSPSHTNPHELQGFMYAWRQ
jgi:FkbM family methyltransferase